MVTMAIQIEYGSRPLNYTQRDGHFLKSTCNMESSDMRNEISDMTWAIS